MQSSSAQANVDSSTGAIRPDRLVIAWLGCTCYAMAMRGSVFLLDAWVPRGTVSGYVPTDPDEVADLHPDAIFIGHGHLDHAADAGSIAEASGAAVYGSAEHCAAVRKSVETSTVRYIELGDIATPVGDRRDVELGGVSVTAIRHLHSTPTAPDQGPEGSPPFFPAPNTSDIVAHPPELDDASNFAQHLFDAEGGSILYQFRIPGFAVVWHDTAGQLGERAPQVLTQLHELPLTDVHLGAIQGFGQFTNGLRDPREYIGAVGGPRRQLTSSLSRSRSKRSVTCPPRNLPRRQSSTRATTAPNVTDISPSSTTTRSPRASC